MRLARAYATAPGFRAANDAMRAGRFTALDRLTIPVTLAWPELNHWWSATAWYRPACAAWCCAAAATCRRGTTRSRSLACCSTGARHDAVGQRGRAAGGDDGELGAEPPPARRLDRRHPGAGFVLVAWVSFAPGTATARRALLAGLVTIWGLRLAAYLAWRNIGKRRGPPLRRMREPLRRPLPARQPVHRVRPPGRADVDRVTACAGARRCSTRRSGRGSTSPACAVGVGMFFETVGDLQLARFKADPANSGSVMDRGLWRYTRHPNYFGDFCVWWGLLLVALAAGGAWWAVVGPIVMTVLLMRVSGSDASRADIARAPAGLRGVRASATIRLRPCLRADNPHVRVSTVDYHTAGEPFRIVTEGVARDPRRDRARAARARRGLGRRSTRSGGCCATSRAATPTCTAASSSPPDDDGADLGVLFWHKDGYSTACGHGTIALGAWAVETGRVAAPRRRRGRRRRSTCRPAGSSPACAVAAARSRRSPSATCRRSSIARGVPARRRRGRRRLRRRDLRLRRRRRAFGLRGRARATCRELIAAGREVKRALDGHRRRAPSRATSGCRASTARSSTTTWARAMAAPAQRHGLRRRRGRPLALRLGHLRPLALLAADGRLGDGRDAAPRLHRRHDLPRAASSARPPDGACSPRSRAPRTAPASTRSCSTRATRSAPASCCVEGKNKSTKRLNKAAAAADEPAASRAVSNVHETS